jgi:hypothetical protein
MQMGAPSGGYCETSSESSADSSTSGNMGLVVFDLNLDFVVADDLIQDFLNGSGYETESESEADSNTTDDKGLVVFDANADFVAIDDIIQDFLNG